MATKAQQRSALLKRILHLRDDHFKRQHGIDLYDYQRKVSDRIIKAVVSNEFLVRDASPKQVEKMKTVEIPVELARQSGKTVVIVHTVEFVMLFFPRIFDSEFPIGLFAPQKEQAKTDFDRLKNLLLKTQKKLVIVDEDKERRTKEENNARTIAIANGASCFIAPVTKASKSESKTFKLMLFEEAQDVDDRIMEEDIFPMAAATNAPRVFIGTAGIRVCAFQKMVDPPIPGALVYDWRKVAADRKKLYRKTKDTFHLMYEQFVKNEIAKRPLGEQDDAIRRPYGLEWITDIGTFTSKAKLHACRVKAPAYDEGNTEHDHYWGLDQAKHVDQMVFKIGRVIDNRLTVVRSLELQGVDYPDQFDAVCRELSKFKVAAGAIDSTGQGDYMPDQFKRSTDYLVYPVTFTQQSKDAMYKSLDARIMQAEPDRDSIGFGYFWSQENASANQFEQEMLELVKEYKGRDQYYLSVHHPDKPGAHDDHPDAAALMNYAYDQQVQSTGIVQYYKQKGDTIREKKEEVANGTV